MSQHERLERCERCKFWERSTDGTGDNGDESEGYCLRFPPVWTGSFWDVPNTTAADYCGEFQAKPE